MELFALMLVLPLLVARCLLDPLHAQPGPYRRVRRRSVRAALQPSQSVELWLPKQASPGAAEQAKRSYCSAKPTSAALSSTGLESTSPAATIHLLSPPDQMKITRF
jgi:hypothetical protein